LRLAAANAGSNMAASIAMMAITTNNSISVNPGLESFLLTIFMSAFLFLAAARLFSLAALILV
jgi:hypothetical protein